MATKRRPATKTTIKTATRKSATKRSATGKSATKRPATRKSAAKKQPAKKRARTEEELVELAERFAPPTGKAALAWFASHVADGLTWYDADDGHQLALDHDQQIVARTADGVRLKSVPAKLGDCDAAALLVEMRKMFASIPGPVPADPEVDKLALEFVKSLARRAYPRAYARTSRSYQTSTTRQDMQRQFERLLEADDGEVIGPISMDRAETLDSGGASAYVSIGGENNEGVFVIVDREDDKWKIFEVEWGRP